MIYKLSEHDSLEATLIPVIDSGATNICITCPNLLIVSDVMGYLVNMCGNSPEVGVYRVNTYRAGSDNPAIKIDVEVASELDAYLSEQCDCTVQLISIVPIEGHSTQFSIELSKVECSSKTTSDGNSASDTSTTGENTSSVSRYAAILRSNRFVFVSKVADKDIWEAIKGVYGESYILCPSMQEVYDDITDGMYGDVSVYDVDVDNIVEEDVEDIDKFMSYMIRSNHKFICHRSWLSSFVRMSAMAAVAVSSDIVYNDSTVTSSSIDSLYGVGV